MIKNSLFFKIIMIFTLPAVGILYFTTILAIEKIDSLKDVEKIYNNLIYLESTEELIQNLQKERGLSVTYNESKEYKSQLINQRISSDESFKNYIKFVNQFLKEDPSNLVLESKIKSIQDNFFSLNNKRAEIEKLNCKSLEIINFYSEINQQLLDTVYTLRSIKNAVDFNNEFLNIFYFLSFKEQVGIERALISISVIRGEIDEVLKKELHKVYVTQKINFDYFHMHSSVSVLNIYNQQSIPQIVKSIDDIKSNLENNLSLKNLSIEDWWNLSSIKVDSLDTILKSIVKELEQISKNTRQEAYVNRNVSLFFLFVSFSTLLGLLFVLRKIIFDERKSVEKIEKQKMIYELLNETNKYLLKKDNKSDLYTEIHTLISKNPSMVFSFIYDLEEENYVNRMYGYDGTIKSYILSKLQETEKISRDNLLSKAINFETNIIVKSFDDQNISVLSPVASTYGIKSAALFPIKKFAKVVSVLAIYSNELKFFDKEIEILFDKLVSDMTHCLEKIEYEKIRLKQEDELRLSSYAFESSEPMLITNNLGKIVKVNQAFCNTMGYAKDEIIGRNPRIFKSLHQDKKFGDELWNSLRVKGYWSGEFYNKKSNDEIIPLRSTITAIKNKDGEITHFLGQYIDIGEQKDREKILEYQATHGNLTGLPNSLLLLDRIEHAITKVVRHQIIGGLIFIDLDNFKEVNDTLGHDIGDILLITVARKIKEVMREEDTIARIGGDEFIVLLDNIGNSKDDAKLNIANLAQKIKNALNSITHIDGHLNVSTPSIGITLFNDASVSVKDIIKQADTAMYVAKKQGKNAIEFFD